MFALCMFFFFCFREKSLCSWLLPTNSSPLRSLPKPWPKPRMLSGPWRHSWPAPRAAVPRGRGRSAPPMAALAVLLLLAGALAPAAGFELGTVAGPACGGRGRAAPYARAQPRTRWTTAAAPLRGVSQRNVPRLTAARRDGACAVAMQDAAAAASERPAALASPAFGDTGGAILLVEGVSLSAGARDIVVDADLKVNRGEVVGLVGQNGAGKSTLLSAIAGRRPLDGGAALVKPGTSVGYLVQTAVSGSQRSAWVEAASGMERVAAAEHELAEAQEALSSGRGDATRNAERLAQAVEIYEAVGGPGKDQRIERVLNGLGFSREDHNRSCTEFSGGWQMRIALARLLLSEPELLLLDEPTNHLDLAAKRWLTSYLAQYQGTIVLVSHEEALLEACKCTAIAEIRDKKLHFFRCGYRKFMEERGERVERAKREYEAQQKEIAHLQSYIDRFGAKANLAASAQSRKKKIERMDILEAPEALQTGKRPKLVLPEPPKCRADMVRLNKARIGWGGAGSSERSWMYDNLDMTVTRGMRMVILGPNGVGKSSLLWALAGRLKLLSGTRTVTDGLRLGFFTQDLAQELDPARVALDVVMENVQMIDGSITTDRARATMGALGLTGGKALQVGVATSLHEFCNVLLGMSLTGGKALQTIGSMSGGEKARVALAMFVLVPHNLLLLDEPSNHLDVGAVDALTSALVEYTGAP